MPTFRHRHWTLALLAGALAGIATVAGLALRAAPVQAQALPNPTSLIAPPACTCSTPVASAGSEMVNCTCGALQCVLAGKGPAVQPALVCVK